MLRPDSYAVEDSAFLLLSASFTFGFLSIWSLLPFVLNPNFNLLLATEIVFSTWSQILIDYLLSSNFRFVAVTAVRCSRSKCGFLAASMNFSLRGSYWPTAGGFVLLEKASIRYSLEHALKLLERALFLILCCCYSKA